MPESPFIVLEENPNVVVGGGGCLCDPCAVSDCCGPFIVVPHNDMDNVASPHVVVGARCVARLSETLAAHGAEQREHQRPVVVEVERQGRKPRKAATEVPEV